MAMKIFSMIALILVLVLITMDMNSSSVSNCYTPKYNEWDMFAQSQNYTGVCNSNGDGCAAICDGERNPDGQCVKTGAAAFDCKCYCNKRK